MSERRSLSWLYCPEDRGDNNQIRVGGRESLCDAMRPIPNQQMLEYRQRQSCGERRKTLHRFGWRYWTGYRNRSDYSFRRLRNLFVTLELTRRLGKTLNDQFLLGIV